MFKSIMVPVDLTHRDTGTRALDAAAPLAQDAVVHLVGVTGDAPSAAAHSPQEYAQKLDAYAGQEAEARGLKIAGHMKLSNDPAVDLDSKLLEAAKEVGADLVVMATHVPGFAERLRGSHGGHLATHAKISVFLVR